ncbi:hypothetical protein, partial [Acinetobacter nosocomialis]|uniref:hypothetical protein n=1 Tax=Acinetobacter nosocomialis TaxID=106654 RepID=UPI001C07C03D
FCNKHLFKIHMYIINNSAVILLIINYKINEILNILNKNTYYKIKLNKVFFESWSPYLYGKE